MFKKKVAILTLVSVISSFSANTTAVLAHELTKAEKISTQENSADNNEESRAAQTWETSQEEEKSQEQEKSQTEESKETSQDSQEESTEWTESTITKKTITLTQNGDTKAKASENLRMVSFGTDLQSTGIVAKPGEKITIYVEADDNAPLPRVAFTQHEAHYANWIREYQLEKSQTEESKETSQDSQEESTESTESTITKKTITLTQNGDTKAKARENLRMVSF